MPDVKKQEHRRRLLKQREAEERRRVDEEDAEDFYSLARTALREGDVPGAARLAKKANELYPGYGPCLAFLGSIYWENEQFADALYYFIRPRNSRHTYASELVR